MDDERGRPSRESDGVGEQRRHEYERPAIERRQELAAVLQQVGSDGLCCR